MGINVWENVVFKEGGKSFPNRNKRCWQCSTCHPFLPVMHALFCAFLACVWNNRFVRWRKPSVFSGRGWARTLAKGKDPEIWGVPQKGIEKP